MARFGTTHWRVTGLCWLAMIAGCGGGGDSTNPAPTLSITSSATTGSADEGGGPITVSLAGVTAANGTITWTISPNVGSVSNASSTGAAYAPPAVGTLTAATTVGITATPAAGAAVTVQVAVNLVPLAVTGSSPNASSRADVRATPTVTFTRVVAAVSLSASSASLSSPIGAVAVSRAASGPTVTVTPLQPLVWGTRYTLALTTQVTSTIGQSLTAPSTLNFETKAPTWSGPLPLAPSPQTTGDPAVAFDAAGNAFAVWLQDRTGNGLINVYAARYSASSQTWSNPTLLLDAPDNAAGPKVVADGAGNAIAVWYQGTGSGQYLVHTARYRASQGSWGGAAVIQTVTDESAGIPRIALDAAGNGMVLWRQYEAKNFVYRVYVARYSAQSDSWAPAHLLSGPNSAGDEDVRLDANGNAIAVWGEADDGFVSHIHAARYSAASNSWGGGRRIQVGPGPAGNSRVAVDGAGNATAIWTEDQLNGMYVVTAARYAVASDQWAAPQLLPAGSGTSNWPQVEIDPVGNVFVLWQQIHGANVYSLNAARYEIAAGTWSFPPGIEGLSPVLGNPYLLEPKLTVDAAGNANAVWLRDTGNYTYAVFHSRYVVGNAAWGAPSLISGSGTVAPSPISASISGSGEVMAMWESDIGFSILNPQWAVLTGR